MSSMKALNQIDGSELWKKVGFKHSEKVLVALRGVYNLPFNLDDPVCFSPLQVILSGGIKIDFSFKIECKKIRIQIRRNFLMIQQFE